MQFRGWPFYYTVLTYPSVMSLNSNRPLGSASEQSNEVCWAAAGQRRPSGYCSFSRSVLLLLSHQPWPLRKLFPLADPGLVVLQNRDPTQQVACLGLGLPWFALVWLWALYMPA